jgi:hypothetical protein
LSWPSKRREGKGSFSRGRLKEALKENLGRPAPGEAIQAHAFLEADRPANKWHTVR